jgi:hypothetical protein
VSPFAIYARCPKCREELKVRAHSGGLEIEDVFDAVFQWMASSDAFNAGMQRIRELQQLND